MGVAGQAPTAVTGRFVGELKANREDEGENKLDKCLAIIKKLKVSGFIVEIDADGAVFSWCFGGLSHVSPSVEMAVGADETS
jgi:hypothetical protein